MKESKEITLIDNVANKLRNEKLTNAVIDTFRGANWVALSRKNYILKIIYNGKELSIELYKDGEFMDGKLEHAGTLSDDNFSVNYVIDFIKDFIKTRNYLKNEYSIKESLKENRFNDIVRDVENLLLDDRILKSIEGYEKDYTELAYMLAERLDSNDYAMDEDDLAREIEDMLIRGKIKITESKKNLKESNFKKSDAKVALQNVLKNGEEFDIPFKYSDEWAFTDAIEDELERQGFSFENSFRDKNYGLVEKYSDGLETVYVIMDRSLSSRGICVGLVTEL